jgi:hypothetical protein
MGSQTSGTEFIREFREFIVFLQSLWGVLAGISAFFPLSNVLIGVIPMKAYEADGVFNHLSPPLITTVATIVTLFVVLWTFGNRDQVKQIGKRKMQRRAWIAMGTSMVSLIAYMVIHQIYGEYAYTWGWGSDDPRKLLAEIPLLVAYCVFFSLLTRAFMLLGMTEFYRDNNSAS